MLGDSNAGFANSLDDSLTHRMETLQAVLMGEMNPLERRLELAGRRPGIVFGEGGTPHAGSPLGNNTSENNSDTESEQESAEFETADSVEIKIESPNEDALRAANYLAEKHSQAETVALLSENTIEVREEPGGAFSVDVTELLKKEVDGETGKVTIESSIPSMSAAAAARHS